MVKAPFDICLDRISPQQGRCVLTCTKLLRHVPGKRSVYMAAFEGKDCVLKIYENRRRAKSHLRKEWSILKSLGESGLNCPAPYFCGRTPKGDWAIVTEYINNSQTALELYNAAAGTSEKVSILHLLCEELAKLNHRGILQKDLHLGNFLISGDKVFCLDTVTMEFRSNPLNKTESMRQLAILGIYIPKDRDEELAKKYAEIRGWKLTAEDIKIIKSYTREHFGREIKRQLKKTLRTSGRKVRFEKNGFKAVFDRDFCDSLDVQAFIEGIDDLMKTGRVLKSRNTSFLSQVSIDGKQVVVKRYNHKGLWHSFRQTLQTSRAKRSWLHGHRLIMLGINTPRPLAFIEMRKGLLLWTSYIITEYVPGRNLGEVLLDTNIADEEKKQFRNQICGLMTRMHNKRITHGDFKRTNFILSDKTIYVTDLDAMKVHLPGPVFEHRRRKDITRLERMFSVKQFSLRRKP
ncbi:MAG: lipopolysaccharide core heptose(II) kinase RfaY [Phycisphaerae bacterium]